MYSYRFDDKPNFMSRSCFESKFLPLYFDTWNSNTIRIHVTEKLQHLQRIRLSVVQQSKIFYGC